MPDSKPPEADHIQSRLPRHLQSITSVELKRAKRAYTTGSIDIGQAAGLINGERPAHGDLVLAEITRIGQHPRIELTTGRRARLYIGDHVLVCYGDRYAPDQFEARAPLDLEECHLVAAGGIASRMLTRHRRMKQPTTLRPLGLVVDRDGRRLNLRDRRLPRRTLPTSRPMTIAIAGTSMNAGKTTSAAHLIKGLDRAGLKVSSAKITGTGAGGDYWFMVDSGAHPVLDFTHAGYASTFGLSLDELEDVMETLVAELSRHQSDAIVLEVADGIFQEETAMILGSDRFRQCVDSVIFTAGDATGALTGKLWLEQHGLSPIAVSGALTDSPLAIREAERATSIPVYDMEQLANPELARDLVFGSKMRRCQVSV